MLFGLRVIVGGRSKGGAIFNPWPAPSPTGKSLRASHCVARADAPREARRERRDGQGQTPHGPPSGDLLMLELARAFRPDRAVFVADVDGLFTADPKRRRDARLLDKVSEADLSKIEFSSAKRTDVTGSIEGKVRRMFEIAAHTGECLIVNGNVKNRVRDALRGRRVVGTRIARGP